MESYGTASVGRLARETELGSSIWNVTEPVFFRVKESFLLVWGHVPRLFKDMHFCEGSHCVFNVLHHRREGTM